jgi:hypothetical protein
MWSVSAAITFSAVIASLGIFQLALAAGAPWGRLAWGGGHAQLPTSLRIGSLISILVYAVFAIVVLERAGLVVLLPLPEIARTGVWVVAAYMTLGIVVNAISRSTPERFVMTPVALTLAACAWIVAVGL